MASTLAEERVWVELEPGDDLVYRGEGLTVPPLRAVGVYGGQIVAQALHAAIRAQRTNESTRAAKACNSMTGCFLRPGLDGVPAVYSVRCLHSGRSYSRYEVEASQAGSLFFKLCASFHTTEEPTTHKHSASMPAGLPDPDSLPDVRERMRRFLADDRVSEPMKQVYSTLVDRPLLIDSRECFPRDPFNLQREAPRTVAWVRASEAVCGRGRSAAERDAIHRCVLAYISDDFLVEAALRGHGILMRDVGMATSLDHCLWLHRPVSMDEWHLLEVMSPILVSGRALYMGHMWSKSGRLVATIAQEGVLRTPMPQSPGKADGGDGTAGDLIGKSKRLSKL